MIWKFRGFDAVGQKGWVYGDLVHNIKITADKDIPRVMVGGYEVFGESVGLFTGLKDFNNIDIYEGDIIRIEKSKLYLVEFSEASFNLIRLFKFPLCIFESQKMEVIGNMFQNKELLQL